MTHSIIWKFQGPDYLWSRGRETNPQGTSIMPGMPCVGSYSQRDLCGFFLMAHSQAMLRRYRAPLGNP